MGKKKEMLVWACMFASCRWWGVGFGCLVMNTSKLTLFFYFILYSCSNLQHLKTALQMCSAEIQRKWWFLYLRRLVKVCEMLFKTWWWCPWCGRINHWQTVCISSHFSALISSHAVDFDWFFLLMHSISLMATKDYCGCSVHVYEEINALTWLFKLVLKCVPSTFYLHSPGNTFSVGNSCPLFPLPDYASYKVP